LLRKYSPRAANTGVLAISPKTIYGYAERNMIPHFKIEASVRFRGRDVAEWLYNHASLGRGKRRP